MAKGKKTGGRDFAPGISGNPNGRPPLPYEIREFSTATKKDIVAEFQYLWTLPHEELRKIAGMLELYMGEIDEILDDLLEKQLNLKGGDVSDFKRQKRREIMAQRREEHRVHNHPSIRVAIARALVVAAETGDMKHLDRVLNRVIGKVPNNGDEMTGASFHKQLVDFVKGQNEK